MPKRHANSESESEEEDFSEYSDEDSESEEAESDAEPDEADLVAHKPRKPQRPVAYEVPEEGPSAEEEERDGDRGLSESEGALSEKAASSGEHPEDAGREDVQGIGFEVVQNRVPVDGGEGPAEDTVLNEPVEEVKESGSDDGEVLGEIVECGEGEAPARPRAPPQKKKILTKREYPSDSDVSMPDSPKAAPLPKALNGRSMKIETIDPEDDEESEEDEGDDPNDEEFQPDSPVAKTGRHGSDHEDSEAESQEDEDSFIESESDDDTRRRSQRRASTSKKAPQKRGRLRKVGKQSYGASSDEDRTRKSVRRSTRAGSARARRGTYKEDSEEEETEESEEEYVEKKPKKSKGGGKARKPRKAQDEDDFIVDDEEEETPDESEACDEESDEDFTMGRRVGTLRKASKPQRRGRSARSEPSPSDDEESDEDFETRRGGRKQKGRARASGGGATARATRSRAGRMEPKSYYEGGDSEDEEYAAAPAAVEEEEDGEAIESVWSHQPVGTAEKKEAAGEDTAPKAESGPRGPKVDWDRVEFYVKWKGRSYIHNTWESLATLEGLPGFKRVGNYMKRIEQELARRNAVSPEEAELMDVQKEMDLEMLEQYTQVDRIIAEGVTTGEDGEEVQQYFVKWQGLAYEEATWENVNDIAFAQDKIDEFKTREANSSIRGKTVDEARRVLDIKERFLSLAEQPEWLKGGGKLRDYQLEGLNRLIYSWGRDINIILADEMGLGKTLQSVSMLGYLQNEQQIQGPFLVVVPLSVVTNWVKEFRKWVPDMNIVVYVGNRASRDLIMSNEFWTGRKSGRAVKFNALITTYEIVMKDKTKLSQIKWSYLMVDEAHRLKNHEAALYTSLMEFSSKNKLLITGTPLQNNIEELWALLHFLEPRKFPFENREAFIDRYKALQDVKDVAELHEELRPHLLRRVIKDVEKSLPPKYERILRVGMSPLQKQYYKWILERNFQDLNRGAKGGGQLSLLNVVVELKKCCNHPFLFESAEHGYAGDSGDRTRVQRLVLSSGKLVLLDKLLTRLKETGHRVLIFSQMVRMLDILGEYLSLKGYKSQRLDGSTRADLRHQAMEHFNAPGSEDFCFLLSTRAGGLGVNLATADTVIIFDSDWNPQNDLQAMSRAHRIGQQDVVNIYRFVTSGSVEEDILERARQKMILDHLVIQKMNASGQLYLDNKGRQGNKGGKMFKEDDLKAILRFGAEDLFKDKESGEESEKKLENMDIDEILARAEKVDAVAAAGAEEGSDDLMGTFKVANFTSNEDDSTFWNRLIQPVAAEEEAGLGQRAARDRPVKTYMEEQMEETDKKARPKDRKRDKPRSRGTPLKKAAREESVPEAAPIEGAHARVSEWGGGRGLSKKDAAAFVKAVKKFGDESRMDLIAEEAGGAVDNAEPHDQADLYRALHRGCKAAVAAEEDNEERAKGGPVLDFFGVPVKAAEVLSRIKELTLLAKSVRRFNDPPSQYRLKSHPKNPQWHKTCGWTQVDDAHLLLGVHFHGFGNWEKMRTDERLGLDHKIAAAGLSAHETTLPRAVHLDARAAKLLKEEREHIEGPSKAMKGPLLLRKPAGGGVQRGRKEGGKRERDEEEEGEVGREEGEISGGEEKWKKKKRRRVEDSGGVKGKRKEGARREERPAKKERGAGGDKEARKDAERARKDEKWRRWCAEEMSEMQPTLDKLQGLQDRDDLSKKETIAKVKKYLKTLGEHIDMVIDDHPGQDPERLANRLWAYTATFSSMEGTKLADVYQKLKAQKKSPEEPPPPPSHRWPPPEKALHARPASGERFPREGDSRRPEREAYAGRGRPVSRDQPRVHSPNILLVERPPSRELLAADGLRPPSRDRLPLDRGVPARGDYYPPERAAPYLDPHDRPFVGGRGAPPTYSAERPRYPVRGDVGYDVRLDYPADPLAGRHRAAPNVLPEMVPVGRGPVPEMEPPQEAYRWRERGALEPGYLGPSEVPPGGPGWRGGEFEAAPRWGGQARRWRDEPEPVPVPPPPGRWGRVEPGYSARERQMWQTEYPPREDWARGGGPGRGYGGRGFEPQERISPRGMPEIVREPLWDGPPRPGRTAGSYGEEAPGRRWEAAAAPLSVDKKVIVEERTDPTNSAET